MTDSSLKNGSAESPNESVEEDEGFSSETLDADVHDEEDNLPSAPF